MSEWKNKWGESKSLSFNKFGLKEPVNALSSFIMTIFVLINICGKYEI